MGRGAWILTPDAFPLFPGTERPRYGSRSPIAGFRVRRPVRRAESLTRSGADSQAAWACCPFAWRTPGGCGLPATRWARLVGRELQTPPLTLANGVGGCPLRPGAQTAGFVSRATWTPPPLSARVSYSRPCGAGPFLPTPQILPPGHGYSLPHTGGTRVVLSAYHKADTGIRGAYRKGVYIRGHIYMGMYVWGVYVHSVCMCMYYVYGVYVCIVRKRVQPRA